MQLRMDIFLSSRQLVRRAHLFACYARLGRTHGPPANVHIRIHTPQTVHHKTPRLEQASNRRQHRPGLQTNLERVHCIECTRADDRLIGHEAADTRRPK